MGLSPVLDDDFVEFLDEKLKYRRHHSVTTRNVAILETTADIVLLDRN